MISLAKNWWLVLLRGVLAILFGLAAFLWPGVTLLVLITFFGVYALVDGVLAIVTGVTRAKDSPRWWVFLLEGLVSIGAGLVALIWPGLATAILIAVIAAWAVITGVFEIAAAIRLRREINNEWLLMLGGLLSIAFGVLLVLQPAAGGLFLIWLVGAYELVFGVLLIALGFRLKNRELPSDRRMAQAP
ncbi:MAG TPA: HdeD family acid-resistance protein [Anaerolineales bacterium]|nr:HdeD family acid-resistance protein [Anaerolineales bacterium]